MTVYCRDCDNVHSDTRGKEPWKWRCIKVPTKPGFGYVDPTYSPEPPYEKCSRVRTLEQFAGVTKGEVCDYVDNSICSLFTPLRKAKEAT